MRKVELLAPARDAEIGKAAILHGADAVYIGAPKFGARAAASNDIKDIEDLASYGHIYGAKTFVAFNTLIKDSELEEAERMLWQIYEAGVDALIIQDLGLLKLSIPPIPLHASTQTDNRTLKKVQLMRDLGMTRVVLARELNVEQISEIHKAVPDIELECFVHGALCVCVSGQCYLSEALSNRSANRGVCAQPCRLPMSLLNADGREVVSQKHLLSLKDMNRSALLEDLIQAGVTSLKIEGRLKDMSYVKNVTAYYRRELDRILSEHSDWQAQSDGKTYFTFEPVLEKSFNRGFTSYQKDREDYCNFETPKSIGEYLGRVKSIGRTSLIIDTNPATTANLEINNGDGLMVGNIGFRANKVIGKEVWPLDVAVLKDLRPEMEVWRNLNYKFEQILERDSAKRKIATDIIFSLNDSFATLLLSDGTSKVEICRGPFPIREKPTDNDPYIGNLSKFGNSPFELRNYSINTKHYTLNIKSSELNEMRRVAVRSLLTERLNLAKQERLSFIKPDYLANAKSLNVLGIIPSDFRANALNHLTKELLVEMKMPSVDDAFEKQKNDNAPLMVTRHCLKYALGQCHKYGKPKDLLLSIKPKDWHEPMCLKIGEKKFILNFGCKNLCLCEIFPIFAPQ